MIYFISVGPYVKVGYTSNLKQRYKKYVTENPDQTHIIATFNGGYNIEKAVHKYLKQYHYRGEWFHYNEAVRAEIMKLKRLYKDTKEPETTSKKQDKHLTLLKLIKSYSRHEGVIELNSKVRNEFAGILTCKVSTINYYLSKLTKLNLLKIVDKLYYY